MEHALMHRLARALWRLLVIAIVLLAAYVSFGRLLVDRVGSQQDWILARLNQHLPFTVAADQVSGDWRSFSPELVLSGLRLQFPGYSGGDISLDGGRVRINPLRSLLEGGLRVSRLRLEGLSLPLQLDSEGRFSVVGFEGGDGGAADWLRNLALSIEQLELRNNRLEVSMPGGETRGLALEFNLLRDGSQRELSGALTAETTGTYMRFTAEGLGNPFATETFEGRAYLGAHDVDLQALGQWLPAAADLPALTGTVELQAWLDWREGKPHLRTRLRGDALQAQARDERWQLPLQQLAFDALLQRDHSSWRIVVQNLLLASGEARLVVPRLQLDSWGDSLRLRGESVPVGPLNQLFAGLGTTPPELADAMQVLDARGLLQRLELSLDDRHNPRRGWQVAANFRDINLNSWRGAPGTKSATGYLSAAPGRGTVVLDAQDFSLDFPTIYDHPLDYEDIYGTVDIHWDNSELSLHSGQIVAQAAEGQSHALFRLQVPFTPTPAGVEMDLLVGLRDSTADHRDKYLPTVLDPGLLDWLRDGLGEGRVEQGAFLWRGSLKPQADRLRTVQLFFQVEETALRYQPDWPPLADLSGLVLIDDTNVSVWGDSASLYGARLEQLSAEAWLAPGHGMQLAINGQLQGSVADGLRLVKESPLADASARVFDDWRGTGDLDLELELALQLRGDAPPPQVTVAATVSEAGVDMGALNLQVTDISGQVDYTSTGGFHSSDLQGQLWGQTLDARLAPLPRDDASTPGLAIELEGAVPADDLQAWLGLQAPYPGTGVTGFSGVLQVPGGGPATLQLTSGLEGVAIALPPPLNKVGNSRLPLSLSLQLDGATRLLSLDLERRLQAALLLGEGGALEGGDIALQERARPPQLGSLRVRGHLPELEPARWQRWLAAPPADGSAAGGEVAPGLSLAALPPLVVDSLLLDSLHLGGLELRDVMLSGGATANGGWQLSAETDWLQGELSLAADGGRGDIHLSHLDLSGLRGLGGGQREADFSDLPHLAVQIDQLRTDRLDLGNLAFDLYPDAGGLRAASITGELAGMALTGEQAGELLWRREGGQSQTSLSATLDFVDLGAVLERLDYERIVDTEGGHFTVQLDWPGGPQEFALAATQGAIGIELGEGRFLDAPAGTSGTLRVVSIFNLTEIVRRLSLSHMFESGIPFDSVSGELFFHRGSVEVPGLEVKGASSSFNFSVISPLAEQTLDGELVATLPVASNLPWVAALTAGLPVAAGVYVVSKVFEQQMNRVSSAVYSVGGSWDDPEVSFSRIFDTGSRQRSAPESPADPNSLGAPDANSPEAGSPGADSTAPTSP
ncbi:YhdP family protein [Parahaliea aestuarii]|uniref:TIGR02099 family protein n=1 Tax=Parahaliea aestuarii TaxID=1852021 RepID=A0A5C9A6S0_9GAMM|nr:YhdP family protein [Parahaliea aestuarii]TXS94891.1 TIGR02099 family protein [Parahaliea aestuarii]